MQPQRSLHLAEEYIDQHREEPPSKFDKYIKEADQIVDQLSQGHAEFMNEVEQGRSTLITRLLGISRNNALGELPEYLKQSFRGDSDDDPLIGELDSRMTETKDRNGGHHAQYPNASRDDAKRSDLPAALRAQVDIGRNRKPIVPYNTILKQMKQMTMEILFARIEIARVYQEWEKMASLADTAIGESDNIGSKSFLATSNLHRGIALYNIRVHWEATNSFEVCQKWTKNREELAVVKEWLEKVYQAQMNAQSAFSVQSPVFNFDHMRRRSGTDSVPVTPGDLRHELELGSDFDSVRGFGSRAPSVASSPVEDIESPQQRRSTSIDRGSNPISPRPRERGSTWSVFPEPSLLSPHWTPTTSPRISSPLAPRKSFTKEMQSQIDKQGFPIPTRAFSVGYEPPSRRQEQSWRPELGRTMSVIESSSSVGGMKSQRSYRAQSTGKQPRQLRENLLDHMANREEHRRKSELTGIEEFRALGRTSKARRPSSLADGSQMKQKLDRLDENSDDGSSRDINADRRSLKPGDLQAELDRVGSSTNSSDNEDASQQEPPTRSYNQEPGEPFTASSPADGLPSHRNTARRQTWAELPTLEYDDYNDFKEVDTQNEDTSTGTQAEPNQYERSLAEELEDADILEESDSVQQPVESNASALFEQSPFMNSDSKPGDEKPSAGEPPAENGGTDDLYGVEDDYVPPSARSTSATPTPVTATATETEKDPNNNDAERKDVSPTPDAPPRPTEQLAHFEADTSNEQPPIELQKQAPTPVTETDNASDDEDVDRGVGSPKPDTPSFPDEEHTGSGLSTDNEQETEVSEKPGQDIETPAAEVEGNESVEQDIENSAAESPTERRVEQGGSQRKKGKKKGGKGGGNAELSFE